MKRKIYLNKLITSVFMTILLIYFMMKTTSPKIIFVPFLICSISMVGKNVALLLDKQKYIILFSQLFIIGFLFFWFGVLILGFYLSIRDHNYSMIIFSLPFWIVGIYIVKNKLLKMKSKNKRNSKMNFAVYISAALVSIVFLAGLFLVVSGILEHDITMIFAGAFFTFGSFTFVLAALTVMGFFDGLNIDVLGLYIGVIFVVIGFGFIMVKYGETLSLYKTIQTFGLWILIPIMLIFVGVVQVIKCLKNRN